MIKDREVSAAADWPYASLTVAGPDAFQFLQAQLSNDLRILERQTRLLSSWCNPKGRVICMLRVMRSDNGYVMALPADLLQIVVDRMALFRFRAKVEFAPGPVTAELLGVDATQSLQDWLLQNLCSGCAEIWHAQSELFTPHMLNLDKLAAISLDKGCYPGQEIVARTHYRGKSRRRMARFRSATPIQAGDEVYHGEQKLGEVVNAIGRDLLAIVPQDTAGAELSVAGARIERLELPYAV